MANVTPSKNGRLNGSAPALIRHGLTFVVGLVAGVFALAMAYADVEATGEQVVTNTGGIAANVGSINTLVTDVQVIGQRFEDERAVNKEFRAGTSRKLDRILSRLPRRERPVR